MFMVEGICMVRPYVIIYTTISIDGQIGIKGRKVVLSKKCDLERLHMLRSYVDAVLVGANTVINDDPLLTVRLEGYTGEQPYRIVVDGMLRSPLNANVFNTSIAPTILFTSTTSDPYKKNLLKAKGVDVIELNGEKFSFKKIFDVLKDRYHDINTVLVEGGGRVISNIIMEHVFDELILVISPIILGKSISLFPIELPKPISLTLYGLALCKCGEEVILRYRLNNRSP